MIVICDKAQDIVIPAGLGDNAGVVYEKSGVESLNGQQGDLTLKTVNGNELLGEGNIEIKSGVESVNGETGAVKIKSVNGTDMLGEGNVAIDTGVESLNGQKGALTLKTVNGNELTGEGNIEIQAGVESVNGETGAVKIKSVNGQSLVGDGDVQIQAGLKYFDLTADKAKEAYDEVANHWDDKSGYTGDYVFRYKKESGGVYTFDEMGYIKDHSISFSWLDNVGAYSMDGNVKCFSIIIWKDRYEFSTYENDYTIPTKVSQLTNDSDFQTKAQVDTAIENAISGSSGESSKTYYFFNDPTRDPNAPNAHNVEVFRAFDKAVQEGGAFNNFYIVNGNETSGQTPFNPILQVTKMEAVDNGVWGGNKGYYVFAGQKSNVETEKLQVHKYCLTDIGGVIDFMVNAVDGGTWTSGVHSKIDDVLTAGADIPCTFEYLEGCDETYFWANNMGGKQGLYNITFNGGYDGYKGNVVADVYGNDTGVYMAFTVNNVRYTYKKNDANSKWELTKSVQIGGVQSAEVSNIKVLTQAEYDALEPKDPHTMYCIKGQ